MWCVAEGLCLGPAPSPCWQSLREKTLSSAKQTEHYQLHGLAHSQQEALLRD